MKERPCPTLTAILSGCDSPARGGLWGQITPVQIQALPLASSVPWHVLLLICDCLLNHKMEIISRLPPKAVLMDKCVNTCKVVRTMLAI